MVIPLLSSLARRGLVGFYYPWPLSNDEEFGIFPFSKGD
jgi:hypothetical protein